MLISQEDIFLATSVSLLPGEFHYHWMHYISGFMPNEAMISLINNALQQFF